MIVFGRILIVDDSTMMRTIVRKSLEMAKVVASEIVEAKNGLEALQYLELQPFDIMFCDLNMPELNGDELLERMQLMGTISIPPVVIVSSEASTERIDRLTCDRIVGVLRKPFTPEKISKLFAEVELFNRENQCHDDIESRCNRGRRHGSFRDDGIRHKRVRGFVP